MVHEVTGDGPDLDGVGARKTSLRRTVRAAREDLTAAQRWQAADAAVTRLASLPDVHRARTVLLYAAGGSELDVMGLATRLRERGVTVCFPRVAGDELIPVAASPLALRPGYRGIAEPDGPARDLADLDVVVVPGLAFDLAGGRLGQGGGHYDRLLRRVPTHTVRVGVGYSCQLVPRVPVQPHDEVVDLVVTDHGVHPTGARARPEGG